MKNLGSDEVYYVVAALTVIILLVYIHAGEVIPLVGFLLSGSLVYALYPNKSVALVAGVVLASLLQLTKREGFEGEKPAEPPAESAPAPAAATAPAATQESPLPSTPPSAADTAGVIDTPAIKPVHSVAPEPQPAVQPVQPVQPVMVQPSVMSSGANNAGSLDSETNSATTTSAPAPAAAPLTPEQQRRAAIEESKRRAKKLGNSTKEQLANFNPSDLNTTDMDQLSTLIDKTTDLLKMLPEGFLAKASI